MIPTSSKEEFVTQSRCFIQHEALMKRLDAMAATLGRIDTFMFEDKTGFKDQFLDLKKHSCDCSVEAGDIEPENQHQNPLQHIRLNRGHGC